MIPQMEPNFDDKEKQALIDYMDSEGWLTEHNKTRELEKMIADYTGSKYCSMLCNGTVTILTALLAYDIGRGSEVIVPDYTMIASVTPVTLVDARPVFVDVTKQRFCMDFQQMKKVVTPKTKAVILVSINGRFPKYGLSIIDFCRDNHIIVIEDAAQSLGCYRDDKHIGTFGDVGSFSFSMPKIISMGQGGALVTNDKEIYDKINMIKNFGRKESGIDQHECLGFNFKYTDLQAVIGIEQMKKLPDRVKRKKQIYLEYYKQLESLDAINFVDTDLRLTAPWMIDVLVVNKLRRKNLMANMLRKEIGTRPFYPAIHTQKPYEWVFGDFPNSTYASEHGLWLPSSTKLTNENIKYVCDTLKKVLKG